MLIRFMREMANRSQFPARRLSMLLLLGSLLLALVGAFAHSMLEFDHNEQMYITAGVLVAQHKQLYQDFAYLQTPYLPLIYGALLRAFHISAYYLLFGKLFSYICYVAACVTLFWITYMVTGRRVASLATAILFALNSAVVNVSAESSNYILPITCTFLAFALFVYGNERQWTDRFALFGCGLLVAIASGVKLYYVTALLPFTILLLGFPRQRSVGQRLVYRFLPFSLGVVCGLTPLLIYLYTDFDRFLFDNLTFHALNTQWRILDGTSEAMSLPAKLQVAGTALLRLDTGLILYASLLALVWLGGGHWFRPSAPPEEPRSSKDAVLQPTTLYTLLTALLTLAGLVTAFVPTPAFGQYFVMPISFLFLLFGVQLARFPVVWHWLQEFLLLTAVLVTLLFVAPARLGEIQQAVDLSNWRPLRIHDTAYAIRAALRKAGVPLTGQVATVSPLYAVEANLPIYPELASGQFLFRIGDLLSEAERLHYVGTSRESITALLMQRPPNAIIVGFSGDLEEPLAEYGEASGYTKIEKLGEGATLYIRPLRFYPKTSVCNQAC